MRCSVVSGNGMDGGAVLKLGIESRCRRQCGAGVKKVAILILTCLETYKVGDLQGGGRWEIRV